MDIAPVRGVLHFAMLAAHPVELLIVIRAGQPERSEIDLAISILESSLGAGMVLHRVFPF